MAEVDAKRADRAKAELRDWVHQELMSIERDLLRDADGIPAEWRNEERRTWRTASGGWRG